MEAGTAVVFASALAPLNIQHLVVIILAMHRGLNIVLGVAVASLRQLFSSPATASATREPAIGRVGLERRCSRECVALDARCGSDRRQFGDWRSDSVVDDPRRRGADRRHPGREREQTRRPVAWRRQRSEGVFFLRATSWRRDQWTHDEGATRIGATADPPAQNNWPIAGSGLSLDLARDRMRFERVRRPPSLPLLLTRGDTIEITHACTRARHTHTTHNDTTGPERGDCMLVGGGCGIETPRGLSRHLLTPTVASPPSNG